MTHSGCTWPSGSIKRRPRQPSSSRGRSSPRGTTGTPTTCCSTCIRWLETFPHLRTIILHTQRWNVGLEEFLACFAVYFLPVCPLSNYSIIHLFHKMIILSVLWKKTVTVQSCWFTLHKNVDFSSGIVDQRNNSSGGNESKPDDPSLLHFGQAACQERRPLEGCSYAA